MRTNLLALGVLHTATALAEHIGRSLVVKTASDAEVSYAMTGRLYLSRSGWLLLTVPNAMLNGIFDALDETGIEKPTNKDGQINAHISVMRPEELEAAGGGNAISERGHMFRYTMGPLKTVKPGGWKEMSRVWFVEVQSPELKQLRKSYGLSPLPNENKYQFHITVAVRRAGVLLPNEKSKVASASKTGAYDPRENYGESPALLGVREEMFHARTERYAELVELAGRSTYEPQGGKYASDGAQSVRGDVPGEPVADASAGGLPDFSGDIAHYSAPGKSAQAADPTGQITTTLQLLRAAYPGLANGAGQDKSAGLPDRVLRLRDAGYGSAEWISGLLSGQGSAGAVCSATKLADLSGDEGASTGTLEVFDMLDSSPTDQVERVRTKQPMSPEAYEQR